MPRPVLFFRLSTGEYPQALTYVDPDDFKLLPSGDLPILLYYDWNYLGDVVDQRALDHRRIRRAKYMHGLAGGGMDFFSLGEKGWPFMWQLDYQWYAEDPVRLMGYSNADDSNNAAVIFNHPELNIVPAGDPPPHAVDRLYGALVKAELCRRRKTGLMYAVMGHGERTYPDPSWKLPRTKLWTLDPLDPEAPAVDTGVVVSEPPVLTGVSASLAISSSSVGFPFTVRWQFFNLAEEPLPLTDSFFETVTEDTMQDFGSAAGAAWGGREHVLVSGEGVPVSLTALGYDPANWLDGFKLEITEFTARHKTTGADLIIEGDAGKARVKFPFSTDPWGLQAADLEIHDPSTLTFTWTETTPANEPLPTYPHLHAAACFDPWDNLWLLDIRSGWLGGMWFESMNAADPPVTRHPVLLWKVDPDTGEVLRKAPIMFDGTPIWATANAIKHAGLSWDFQRRDMIVFLKHLANENPPPAPETEPTTTKGQSWDPAIEVHSLFRIDPESLTEEAEEDGDPFTVSHRWPVSLSAETVRDDDGFDVPVPAIDTFIRHFVEDLYGPIGIVTGTPSRRHPDDDMDRPAGFSPEGAICALESDTGGEPGTGADVDLPDLDDPNRARTLTPAFAAAVGLTRNPDGTYAG